jgi:hypothetical protein
METNGPIPSNILVGPTDDSALAISALATDLIDFVEKLQDRPGKREISPGMAAQLHGLRMRAEKLFENS